MESVPTVTRETTGAECARVIAEYRLGGLVVVDGAGAPVAIVPGSQLLSIVLPQYVRDDRRLAHSFDESAADEMCEVLREESIGALIDAKGLTMKKVPSVLPEDTLIEIASVMDEAHSPLVCVIDRDGHYSGVLTMSRVLAAIATAAGSGSPILERRLTEDIVESVQAWVAEGDGQ